MQLNRRQVFALGAGAALAVTSGTMTSRALAAQGEVEKIIEEFSGGAEIGSGRVSLSAPEIAENGNTVPIAVDVESPMTAGDYVAAVLVLADGNPRPGVATFKFSPMSGNASASTRIRLAKTQDVIAVARMSDGTFFMDRKTVKVTIGGCGG